MKLLSPLPIDQAVQHRQEFGPRLQLAEVGIGLDAIGKLRVCVDRFPEQHDRPRQVLLSQKVALALGQLGVGVCPSRYLGQDLGSFQASFAPLRCWKRAGHLKRHRCRITIRAKLELDSGQINQVPAKLMSDIVPVSAQRRGLALVLDGLLQRGFGLLAFADPGAQTPLIGQNHAHLVVQLGRSGRLGDQALEVRDRLFE